MVLKTILRRKYGKIWHIRKVQKIKQVVTFSKTFGRQPLLCLLYFNLLTYYSVLMSLVEDTNKQQLNASTIVTVISRHFYLMYAYHK